MAGSAYGAVPGVPFTLHVGQSATLGSAVRITLTALMPVGKCPGGHSECVEVSPPQAEADVAAPPAPTQHLVLPLLGRTSPQQVAGTWTVRVVDLAPFPFNDADIAAGRVAVTFLLTR